MKWFKTLLCFCLVFSIAQAQDEPLGDLLGLLDDICGESGLQGATLGALEALGVEVEDTATILCEANTVMKRAQNVIDAAGNDISEFIDSALADGFGLVNEYLDFDIDQDTVFMQDIRDDIEAIINLNQDGLSLEDVMNFIAQSAASQYIRGLIVSEDNVLAELGEDADPLQVAVRLRAVNNPEVMKAELDTVAQTLDIQSDIAEVTDAASEATTLAVSALERADEEGLLLSVTNPNPLDLGMADRAEQRASRSVSTRAAVQAMVDAQASLMRQQAHQTVDVLTALKELSLQSSLTTKQLSKVAIALYEEQIAEANRWRDEYQRELEQNYADAELVASAYGAYADLLENISMQLGTALPEEAP